jgi:hypothetical protein
MSRRAMFRLDLLAVAAGLLSAVFSGCGRRAAKAAPPAPSVVTVARLWNRVRLPSGRNLPVAPKRWRPSKCAADRWPSPLGAGEHSPTENNCPASAPDTFGDGLVKSSLISKWRQVASVHLEPNRRLCPARRRAPHPGTGVLHNPSRFECALWEKNCEGCFSHWPPQPDFGDISRLMRAMAGGCES